MYHGPGGLRTIAERVHRLTRVMAEGLSRLGFEVLTEHYFDTITVRVPGQAGRIAARARESRINLRLVDGDHLGISLDETTRRANVETLWRVFSSKVKTRLDIDAIDRALPEAILPESLRRDDEYLTHPIFHLYHSETEMLRYLRWLQAKDIALDRAMIPLGSCTMKLNSTTEMLPVSYRQFSAIHPFAPLDQTQGYQQLFDELEDWLCELTGFDAISLQPNAGSQGEYAGLLVIRAYHESRGEGHRNVCLIPASAHGTNPASAQMAGMRVVVVRCDEAGNVDLEDLRRKSESHGPNLAALMITYPSTHGVFEEDIVPICDAIHAHGGQVYMDGANFNAMVGICRPASLGADVSHLNLHKTFCIPHGGGGPGMGPIGVKAHLAPYLPDHPVVEGVNPAASQGEGTIGALSAAPWGSAGILPISWAYIAMMGSEGLRCATEVAILNANYVARRLSSHYPVLYTGKGGLVAHECIIDLRPLKESCGVSVDDVAKRLVDYGFHAPHDVVPGPRDPHDRAHRKRVQARAGPLLRRPHFHPPRNRGPRGGPGGPPGQSPAQCAAHPPSSARADLAQALFQGRGLLSPPALARGQVLAAGRAHRQRLRGPQPRLRLPSDGGVPRGRGIASLSRPGSPGSACRGATRSDGARRTPPATPRRRPTAARIIVPERPGSGSCAAR